MPQKITTRLAAVRGEKVKMWGKSPRVGMVTYQSGKPYGLKGHVYRKFRQLADEGLLVRFRGVGCYILVVTPGEDK